MHCVGVGGGGGGVGVRAVSSAIDQCTVVGVREGWRHCKGCMLGCSRPMIVSVLGGRGRL